MTLMSEGQSGDEAATRQREDAKAMRENLLRMILTSEARQRLTNLKIVKPDIAKNVEDQLMQSVTSGQLKHTITDDELKKVLGSFQPQKKDFKIRWA